MKVTLEFSVDEVNYVLMALSQRPFGEVVDLIAKVKSSAQSQLQASDLVAPIETSTTQ
jgi:hypothetical protein